MIAMNMAANPSGISMSGSAALFGGVVRLSDKCIAIGISTGGPPALARLFSELRPPVPPIVVVQHMPAAFTRPLAEAARRVVGNHRPRGDRRAPLLPNQALLAPGGKHLRIRRFGNLLRANVFDGPSVSSHKPSIDVLMTSVAEAFGRRCLGVIMTGMGRDGVAGCAAIRHAGGIVLGQDERSSDVYGMNKIAFVEGHVDRQFALGDVAVELMHEIQAQWLGGVNHGESRKTIIRQASRGRVVSRRRFCGANATSLRLVELLLDDQPQVAEFRSQGVPGNAEQFRRFHLVPLDVFEHGVEHDPIDGRLHVIVDIAAASFEQLARPGGRLQDRRPQPRRRLAGRGLSRKWSGKPSGDTISPGV